jgi:hypothetical protein
LDGNPVKPLKAWLRKLEEEVEARCTAFADHLYSAEKTVEISVFQSSVIAKARKRIGEIPAAIDLGLAPWRGCPGHEHRR